MSVTIDKPPDGAHPDVGVHPKTSGTVRVSGGSMVTDVHHVQRWPADATCACNGVECCRRDHRVNQGGRWTVRRSTDPAHPAGTRITTAPSGREYVNRPPRIHHEDGE